MRTPVPGIYKGTLQEYLPVILCINSGIFPKLWDEKEGTSNKCMIIVTPDTEKRQKRNPNRTMIPRLLTRSLLCGACRKRVSA